MSYRSTWFNTTKTKLVAHEFNAEVDDLYDTGGNDKIQYLGAYGSNLENKLLSWGFSIENITSCLEGISNYTMIQAYLLSIEISLKLKGVVIYARRKEKSWKTQITGANIFDFRTPS